MRRRQFYHHCAAAAAAVEISSDVTSIAPASADIVRCIIVVIDHRGRGALFQSSSQHIIYAYTSAARDRVVSIRTTPAAKEKRTKKWWHHRQPWYWQPRQLLHPCGGRGNQIGATISSNYQPHSAPETWTPGAQKAERKVFNSSNVNVKGGIRHVPIVDGAKSQRRLYKAMQIKKRIKANPQKESDFNKCYDLAIQTSDQFRQEHVSNEGVAFWAMSNENKEKIAIIDANNETAPHRKLRPILQKPRSIHLLHSTIRTRRLLCKWLSRSRSYRLTRRWTLDQVVTQLQLPQRRHKPFYKLYRHQCFSSHHRWKCREISTHCDDERTHERTHFR